MLTRTTKTKRPQNKLEDSGTTKEQGRNKMPPTAATNYRTATNDKDKKDKREEDDD